MTRFSAFRNWPFSLGKTLNFEKDAVFNSPAGSAAIFGPKKGLSSRLSSPFLAILGPLKRAKNGDELIKKYFRSEMK